MSALSTWAHLRHFKNVMNPIAYGGVSMSKKMKLVTVTLPWSTFVIIEQWRKTHPEWKFQSWIIEQWTQYYTSYHEGMALPLPTSENGRITTGFRVPEEIAHEMLRMPRAFNRSAWVHHIVKTKLHR